MIVVAMTNDNTFAIKASSPPSPRVIGVVWVLYFVTGGIGALLTRGIIVSTDAASTANNILTHATVYWELSYCALVWPRLTRPLVIAMAVAVHLGIALFLGMMTFGLVMIIANVAFVSPALVRRILDRRS